MAFPLRTARGLLELSRLAYKDVAEARALLRDEDIRVRRSRVGPELRFLAAQDKRVDTEAYLMRSERGDLIISFRGSEEGRGEGAIRDWLLTDTDAILAPFALSAEATDPAPFVHRGFQRAYLAVRDALHAAVAEEAGGERLYLTGHSLGAALATIAAVDLAEAQDRPVTLVTFGSPRVGSPAFVQLARQRLQQSWLVTQRGDPVPYLPPEGPKRAARRYAHLPGARYIRRDFTLEAGLPQPPTRPNFKHHLLWSYREAFDRLEGASAEETP